VGNKGELVKIVAFKCPACGKIWGPWIGPPKQKLPSPVCLPCGKKMVKESVSSRLVTRPEPR
jgi:hypothetical protein